MAKRKRSTAWRPNAGIKRGKQDEWPRTRFHGRAPFNTGRGERGWQSERKNARKRARLNTPRRFFTGIHVYVLHTAGRGCTLWTKAKEKSWWKSLLKRRKERERERVLEGVGTRRRMRRCACFDLFDRNEYTADIYAMRVKVSHRIFLLLREKKKMIIDYHLSP